MTVLRRTLLPAILAACAVSAIAQSSPTAPTATTLSPEQIDAQWIAATSAYTPARTRVLDSVNATIAAGPFRDDWMSLEHQTVPDWFRDAKFGIFLHWGVFSVPAFGSEWYSRTEYQPGEKEGKHAVATYGPQSKWGYKDFIPQFKMEHFDPAAWASLFYRAGARYVVPVAEHHDGFANYGSQLTQWNAVNMGPKRDIVGDLAKAVRAQGMKFGASSHRAEHDWFYGVGREIDSDVNDPKYLSLYGPAQVRILQDAGDGAVIRDYTYVSQAYKNDWLARSAEIVELYHPDLVYFDWWVGQPSIRDTQRRFAAFYYDYAAKHGQAVVMNYKDDAMARGSGVLDIERGGLAGIRPEPWQTDTSISDISWGYIEGDTYKPAIGILHQLIDVVSKNGNLLLNIGPKSDGTIPKAAQDTLLAIGAWLDMNGEAIYGTRPWKLYGEGPTAVPVGTFQDKAQKPFTADDFRFTTKPGVVYAIELGWPSGGEAVIHSFAGTQIADVTLLGYTGKLNWHAAADGLHISLPSTPPGSFAYSFKVKLQP